MEAMRTKVQQKVKATPPGTWGKVGAGVLVGGLAIGWLVFPFLLDKVVAMVSKKLGKLFTYQKSND